MKQAQVGGSPVYIVARKLGKGGFGQVYVGRRANASTRSGDNTGSNATQVSHHNAKTKTKTKIRTLKTLDASREKRREDKKPSQLPFQ